MSVSYCMHHALDIAQLPLQQWKAAIDALPGACSRGCGAPRSCRTRNADYLRVQYKAQQRLAAQRQLAAVAKGITT